MGEFLVRTSTRSKQIFLSEMSPWTFQSWRCGGAESDDEFWTESSLRDSTADEVRTVAWKSSRLQFLELSQGLSGVW
ncbi:BZ3500_MvSof-1268-A1-R1_Chr4-2g07148 [Microbotryum saponariae]|uniref:BZ3500_MvSof-1268-A1-R1_Chr4-2g07148 protein n=1 Tax=Microbotryum saponariae TaxID=289078 RepID=A0A2X0M473_9BASI|nr:BZ3500_MvSof-1268-A1-R1_Chr4-2g07148 [Microbotryum saponariae]SDA06813.1 BZ3501_MvSof-1269-A2-R1_Chr4-2g06859 [Microbotryum saponariae]